MKISDIKEILSQAKKVGSIENIYFEGGEPFLYYPIMLRGLELAKEHGFSTGIVTNAYWATSKDDAKVWLNPIQSIGVFDFSISDDIYHYDKSEENLAVYAYEAAKELGLPASKLIIEEPKKGEEIEWKGRPVVEGRVMFKGRATEKLVDDLPKKPWTEFDRCLDEDFSNQSRVHIDPFGYVHVCQGITIGNMKQTLLSEILSNVNLKDHPICQPILHGGPVELVKRYGVNHDDAYVDECHLCYSARLKLRDRFPEILAPDQMYGITS